MSNFQFNFAAEVLGACINNTDSATWFPFVSDILALSNYDIITKLRFAAWVAQCGHESMDFKTLEENLNYRSSALLAVFPTHFTAAEADAYQHNPEKIANRVYSNRMGNGDEASGDGWLFHGRGLIQITGRSNYTAASKAMYGDTRLLTTPDLLVANDGAVRSACWFWQTNGLNALADAQNFEEITRRINGGTTGEADRLNRYQHATSVLASVANTAPVVSDPTITPPPAADTTSDNSNWFSNISTGITSWWNGGSSS